MDVEITEAFLSQAAGWEAMKAARAYMAQGQVLSSFWEAPLLRGVVQAGGTSFRASLVIKSVRDIENLCHCRESRQWGKICAHSVAVGLHWVASRQPGAVEKKVRSIASVPPEPKRRESGLRRDADGVPAELFLIFPPNLGAALERGRAMVTFEAGYDGGRCPLNALPKGCSYSFSVEDEAIIDWAEAWAEGETPAVIQLGVSELEGLLPLLVGHTRLSLGKARELVVRSGAVGGSLLARLEASGEIVLEGKSEVGGGIRVGGWLWSEGQFQRRAGGGDSGQGSIRIKRAQVPQFLNQQWPALVAGGGVEANFRLEDFEVVPQVPEFHLEMRGGLAGLSALLQCSYGPRFVTLGVTASDDAAWVPDPEVATRYTTRDISAERAALNRLRKNGFEGPDSQGRLELKGQDNVLNFLAREYPALEREWRVELSEQLENRTLRNVERIQPRFEVRSSGVEWFDLGVVYESGGGETFSAADIQSLLLSGRSHTRLRNGKMAVIDTGAVEDLQEVLLDCAPQQHSGGYRIQNAQAGFLESTLREHEGWKLDAPAGWRERVAGQTGEAKLECPVLGDLESVLRPYQKQGVAWFRFLRENGFGGILADEMGLGKTLQTLAFLKACRDEEAGSAVRRPHLVVCPTSLVFNWVREATHFTPGLKVLALQGADRRALFDEVEGVDLVVTSYALIRRDAELYRDMEFDTVILDEAQHIKNRQTQNARAVKAVKSRHRLVLTGTPLENSVLDLWSIFDFLMPSYLGSAGDFRERYEVPITKERDVAAQGRLARRLRPFLLRRLKRDVASDLPERLEQVSFCELTAGQREAYRQVMEATRKEVLDAVGQQGEARSRMVALNALLRLRQICCDLRLLKLEGVELENTSGKLDLFGELLEEVLDGGHRVLVFSQFVSMLALLEERLKEEGIEYCYLDGSTKDRAGVVERFQRDESVPVFLISLKAGGVGLNLTGADTVIHFDPWWNPAVEDQATDRAHRIGQTRVVTSYKLITRDTVEEKILTLQNRKRDVIKATLGGEEEFAASLTWEEIQEILR